MMKRALQLLAATSIVAGSGQAAPIFALNPGSGGLSGTQGSTVGWGFTITNTTTFLEVVQTDFCLPGSDATDLPCAGAFPSLGSYTDFTALSNFVVVGPSPYTTTLTQNFDLNLQTGFGSFTILHNASLGTSLGEIDVIYDLFDGDPANGGMQLGGDNFVALPASITVAAAATVPEPGTGLPVCFAAAGLILLGWPVLKNR